jgi:hypothetical protein
MDKTHSTREASEKSFSLISNYYCSLEVLNLRIIVSKKDVNVLCLVFQVDKVIPLLLSEIGAHYTAQAGLNKA